MRSKPGGASLNMISPKVTVVFAMSLGSVLVCRLFVLRPLRLFFASFAVNVLDRGAWSTKALNRKGRKEEPHKDAK
jgi:hypothetical protein